MSETLLDAVVKEPSTEEKALEFYHDSSGAGDMVTLPCVPGEFYATTQAEAGTEEVSLKDLPLLIVPKLSRAYDEGKLHSVLSHYVGALEGANVVDARTLTDLKRLQAEANQNRFNESATKITWKKVSEYFGKMKPVSTRRK